jgi:Flp pilus assembly protein TadG
MLRRVHASTQKEAGQVVVFFALLIPIFFALGAVVMDVGNWYVHKRHLQTQVDAAAFAGATKFVGCSPLFDTNAAERAIKASALEYAGDTLRDPSTIDPSFTTSVRNQQVQEPNDVRIALNSSAYWAEGDPTDGSTLDDTEDRTGDGLTGSCNEKALDVKATDDKAPLIWGLIPVHPSPKAHARVEVFQILEENGMLPFAVPEIDPAAVAVLFVNENASAPVSPYDYQLLIHDPSPPNSKFSYWTTPSLQENVDIPKENTSVVVLVSKDSTSPTVTGTLASICGQAPGLVKCYAGSSATSGVNFIHGWSDEPAANNGSNPKIRDVSVVPVGCSLDASPPYFLNVADCTVGVSAHIDFGIPGDPTRRYNQTPAGVAADVRLYASTNCSGNADVLTWQSTLGTESTWTGGAKAIVAGSGRNPLSISWDTTTGSGPSGRHGGCFPLVAAPYAANNASGPLEYVDIENADQPPYAASVDGNSRNIGSNHSIVVTVGFNKPLQLEDPLNDPFLLRFSSKSGSLNQALDCDQGITFKDEIADGCRTTYRLNYYNWDGDPTTPYTWNDILCSAYGLNDLPPASFVNVPAPDCVSAKTGDVVSMRQGLYDRFFPNDACTPNNWPTDSSEIGPFFSTYDFANDPRYITLVITDQTAFTGSGLENVPVKYFAGFYATGWDVGPAGGGNSTACAYNDPHPLGLPSNKDNGDVWGHFVNIVIPSSSGEPSEELCNFDVLGNCIAVLVE